MVDSDLYYIQQVYLHTHPNERVYILPSPTYTQLSIYFRDRLLNKPRSEGRRDFYFSMLLF